MQIGAAADHGQQTAIGRRESAVGLEAELLRILSIGREAHPVSGSKGALQLGEVAIDHKVTSTRTL